MEPKENSKNKPTSFIFEPHVKDLLKQIAKITRRSGVATLTTLILDEAKKLGLKPTIEE